MAIRRKPACVRPGHTSGPSTKRQGKQFDGQAYFYADAKGQATGAMTSPSQCRSPGPVRAQAGNLAVTDSYRLAHTKSHQPTNAGARADSTQAAIAAATFLG